jgi:hypothetical protein
MIGESVHTLKRWNKTYYAMGFNVTGFSCQSSQEIFSGHLGVPFL